MKHFLNNHLKPKDIGSHFVRNSKGRFFQGARNAVTALLLSQTAHADELTLPVGTSVVHADIEQTHFIRQHAQMCHELGESSTGQKILFVMTDKPQTITIRAGEQIESYIKYMRELTMQQSTIDASGINRIKSLTDF